MISVFSGTPHKIHSTAIIEPGAEIASDVVVGPHAIVGPRVVLKSGVIVGAGAIIEGRTSVGENTKIYPYASIGSDPQDLKYAGEDTELIIGRNNRIREYCNISKGTEGGGGLTQIGDNNLFMVYCHVGHDSIIANNCVFANSVAIAGHVEIANDVIFGGLSAAHQFCKIGRLAMVAAGSKVTQDVPPFILVHGDRAKPNGLNLVGLRRAGFSNIPDIKEMYKSVFTENLTIAEAKKYMSENLPPSEEQEEFIAFLDASKRGLCR